MKEAKIITVVETVFDRISIGELYQLYDEGKLITIPEFLQRKLLKKNWFANKYQNCKEYIASCWKGTCSFDSFSIMRLDDLIKTIIELQSTAKKQGNIVTQIIHFVNGEKRTFENIKTNSIKQGQFTKLETTDGHLIMVNDKNVLCIEIFKQ